MRDYAMEVRSLCDGKHVHGRWSFSSFQPTLVVKQEGGPMDTRLNKSQEAASSDSDQSRTANDVTAGTPATEAIKRRVVETTTAKYLNREPDIKIHVKNVNFYYGVKQALYDVTLPIAELQVTALIGPSGCGKTTFLRTLNRMNDLIPGTRTEGEAIMDGRNIYDPAVDVVSLRQRIGMIFQRPNPFRKSIFDNVAYGLHVQKKHGHVIQETVERSLREAALWDEVKDRLKAPALGLSGGQQQRLCIARAVAVRPEVILMDEPCSALDPIATQKIEELITELSKDYTIVIVTHNMQQAGYQVTTAADGASALEAARRETPDLVILDIMLPEMDGLEVCRLLRREHNTATTPIMMLTAKVDEIDKVVGLEVGADDYVTKPFGRRELLARVRALLRRADYPPPSEEQPAQETTVEVPRPGRELVAGPLRIDLAGRRVFCRGQEMELQPKQFDLLTYLVRNRGTVLTSDQLLQNVWGYDYVGDTRTVDVHVRWLREKLEEDPANPRLIQTVRGVGYCFRW